LPLHFHMRLQFARIRSKIEKNISGAGMIKDRINGVEIVLKNTEGLFSPLHIDRGTRAMLECVPLREKEKVLDLGCGSGTVGIYASKILGSENVVMCDIDENAVIASKENAAENGVSPKIVVSNGFFGLEDTGFTVIFSNPPYQSDFAVAKHFIEKGFNRLLLGGRMVMVTKRRAWYENKLKSIFGGCKVFEKDGYFVFLAEKRSMQYAGRKEKKTKI